MEAQEEKVLREFREGWATRAANEPEDEIIKSGVSPDNIRKWKVLQSLQDRNETLFYRLRNIINISFLDIISIKQIIDGQFLRDGAYHLHPDCWLGLLSLLPPLPETQRSVKIIAAHLSSMFRNVFLQV